jgi:iron complex outermembrane receptor protein
VLDAAGYKAALTSYGLTSGDQGLSVDAQDAIFRKGFSQNYNLGISGGNENGKYRFSLGYSDQNGIILKSNLKKYNIGLNGQYKFLESKRLSLDFNVLAAHNTEIGVPVTNDAGFQGNLVGMALQWNPTKALYKTDGSINITPGESVVNPLAMSAGYNDQADITNIFATVGVGYKLTSDLDYKFNFSLNNQTGVRRASEQPYITIPGIEGSGFGYYSNAELTSQVIQHTLDYRKKISNALNLNALVGYEYQKFVYRGSGMTGKDFTNQNNVDFTNIMQNSGSAGRNIYSWYDPTSELQSYFGRLVLNYKDRYLVTGTIRADGSSKFGSNNKYGYFPSGAFAWNIHNEKFMQNNHTFSSLKLRASYGITGNSSFPPGSAQSQYTFGQQSIALANVANPDLKWESTKQFDLGLDFELAGGRFYGNIDYFNRNTTNILFNFDAIQPAPATKYWVNLPGNVKNNGVELSLGAALIKKQDLQWNLTFNVAFLQNVLENYNGPAVLTGAISGQGLSGASVQRLESGHPLNAFYLKEFKGLDQTGNSTFTDNGNTLYYIGDPNPHQLYGISTDVTYKKWSFVANLNGAAGHDIYNNTLNALIPIGNLGSRNVATSLIGGAIKESLANPITTSTRYLEKGDYLKLANLSASYNVGNVGVLKNLRLFLTASNLFIITKYSGFDPEVNTDKNVGGVPSLGIEYIPYPSAKSFNFGLNFSL